MRSPLFAITFGEENLVDLSEQRDYEFPHPVQRWVMALLASEATDNGVAWAKPLGTASRSVRRYWSQRVTSSRTLKPTVC